MSNTIFEISKLIKAKLTNLYASSEVDSFIFMIYEEVLGISSAKVLAFPEQSLSNEEVIRVEEIILRLSKSEPIQYIFGKGYFYDLCFKVTKSVLIPRPETEELVHWILTDFGNDPIRVVDVGTGSGAIPIALAKNRNAWQMHALDVSPEAIEVARENARENKVKVDFHEINILKESLPTGRLFDVVVSNPPYVTESEKTLMQANVLNFEPHLALFVDDNLPLLFYERIAHLAKEQLATKGFLFFEINEQFGTETINMLEKLGFERIELRKDLSGKDRMIKAMKV